LQQQLPVDFLGALCFYGEGFLAVGSPPSRLLNLVVNQIPQAVELLADVADHHEGELLNVALSGWRVVGEVRPLRPMLIKELLATITLELIVLTLMLSLLQWPLLRKIPRRIEGVIRWQVKQIRLRWLQQLMTILLVVLDGFGKKGAPFRLSAEQCVNIGRCLDHLLALGEYVPVSAVERILLIFHIDL
jgi:hypothetical protein